MYRLIATTLLRQGYDVIIPAYTFYNPGVKKERGGRVGDTDHQIDDVEHCLHYLTYEVGMFDRRRRSGRRRRTTGEEEKRPVVLVGHSSGAHLCFLMMLRRVLLGGR